MLTMLLRMKLKGFLEFVRCSDVVQAFSNPVMDFSESTGLA